jgi:predicted GIY-YIG superfamily endonuclease
MGGWFCYMVRCSDGSFYVGVATDLEARLKEHNWGVGARFTAKRRPVELVWWQEFRRRKKRGLESGNLRVGGGKRNWS